MDLDGARQRLIHERAALLAMGHDLATSFDDIVAAAKDSNLDDEHDPEGSTIAVDRSLVSSLGRSTADRIEQIDKALARLDAGTYGRCLRCGAPIGGGRLAARPAAQTCIGCAE